MDYRVKLQTIYDHAIQTFNAKYISLDDKHLTVRKKDNSMLVILKDTIIYLNSEPY